VTIGKQIAAAAIATSVFIAACGGPSSSAAPPSGGPTAGPTADGASGTIFVSGSSTVEPVSQAVSEDFKLLNPDFGFTVEGPGTGDGFALFCEGTSDVADASRAIRDSEAQACADNGIDYVELMIGVDALTVMTHPGTPVDCLTPADLYALFGPESDNVSSWKDASAVPATDPRFNGYVDAATIAAELGSTTVYPELALQITAPGEESGTYDAFIELADIAGPAVERGVIGAEDDPFLRLPGPNYTASGNDNVIVEGVEAGAGSLGFVGYAFFAHAGAGLKAISIDGGEGCVAPSPETAADGSYALTRPLFIYVNTAKADANPALAAWVDFYLSDAGIANVVEVDYVALPAGSLQATRDAWANR
jgi:phosphate transport system substrate-binding protein